MNSLSIAVQLQAIAAAGGPANRLARLIAGGRDITPCVLRRADRLARTLSLLAVQMRTIDELRAILGQTYAMTYADLTLLAVNRLVQTQKRHPAPTLWSAT